MSSSEIANRLYKLAGSWQPGGAATPQDLRAARLYLADGLLGGIAPQTIQLPAFHSGATDHGRLEADAIAELAKPGSLIVPSVRNSIDINPAALAEVVGMSVSDTLGPFTDPFGVTHRVDLIPLARRIPISSATRGILAYLTIDATSPMLGTGSIWVAVAALNVHSATTGAVGLSFSGGAVRRSGNVTISGTGVTIGAGGKLELDLKLAPPSPPPGLPGIGRDVMQMSLHLPMHVTIEFTEAGAGFVAIDGAAATVYGTSCSLTRNTVLPRVVDLGFSHLFFPCDASIAQFAFQTVLSTDVVPSGESPVTGAGWVLPVTMAPPQQLGEASSAGSLALELGSGLSLRIGGLEAPISLEGATLVLAPGSITIRATNGSRQITDRLTLWAAAPSPALLQPASDRHSSEIEITIPRGAVLFASVSTQLERGVASGRARVNVDRPLASNGRRLPMDFASALIAFARAVDKSVTVTMAGGSPQRAVMALENALLRVGPATEGLMHAVYAGARLVGALELTYENAEIIPILPDPYASAYVVPLPLTGAVFALDTWTPQQPGATLRFSIIASLAQEGLEDATLLDLSGNADQFGVSLLAMALHSKAISLDGMGLAVPQQRLAVYALPGISWEPVADKTQDNWLNAASPDDGSPTTLQVQTVNLVRVEPNIALPALAQAGANTETSGRFTLPFGLFANSSSQREYPVRPASLPLPGQGGFRERPPRGKPTFDQGAVRRQHWRRSGAAGKYDNRVASACSVEQ